jgi:hypothetical protein
MILIYNFYCFLCSEQYWLSMKRKKNNNKNIEKLKAFYLPDILINRDSTVKPRSLFKNHSNMTHVLQDLLFILHFITRGRTFKH